MFLAVLKFTMRICSICIYVLEIQSPNSLDKCAKAVLDHWTITWIHKVNTLNGFILQCYFCCLDGRNNLFNEVDLFQFDDEVLLSILGFFICCSGFYLRQESKNQLGRFFTYTIGVSPEQILFLNGLYTYIMHPSYLGSLLIYSSMCLIHSSVTLFVTFLVFFVCYMSRIKIEEDMLAAHFGDEFVKYKLQRNRLIPLVY